MSEMANNGGGARQYLWRAVLLAGGLWLGWQALCASMADHHLERVQQGEREALASALWWRPEHPRALALQGRRLLGEGDAHAAEALLQRAVAGNPADARPLVELARQRADAGQVALADDMIDTAHRLMPVHPAVQRSIGLYWLRRGEPARGIGHIATALSGDASLRQEYFPLLLAAAEDPALRQTLAPLAAEPPPWWGSFFQYASREARSADSLAALLEMRADSRDVPPTAAEREQFLQRLHRDGRVADAYLQWVNALDARALEHLGYVFDGGFELPLSNSGFGWFGTVPHNAGFRITTGVTYGMTGERALRLGFAGKRARFSHLYQNLFLGPGRYEVSGMARPEALRARRGLQWRVHCNAGGTQQLGESELLEGSGEWRRFTFHIEVPEACAGQVLRLYSAGNRDVDHELAGGIWFDELRIARRPESRSIRGKSSDSEHSSHAGLASDKPDG